MPGQREEWATGKYGERTAPGLHGRTNISKSACAIASSGKATMSIRKPLAKRLKLLRYAGGDYQDPATDKCACHSHPRDKEHYPNN